MRFVSSAFFLVCASRRRRSTLGATAMANNGEVRNDR
jgi:hypothetical protein